MCPLLVTIVQRVKNKKSPECDVLFEMVFDYSFGNIIFISKDYVHVHMLLCICLFQLPMSCTISDCRYL